MKTPGFENPAIDLDPVRFTSVRVKMAVYPVRAEGEGPAHVSEKMEWVSAAPIKLQRRGKRPPPPQPRKITPGDPGSSYP